MDNNAANVILAYLDTMSRDLAMENERLDRMVGQREQVGCPDTHQQEGCSSYELRGKNVIPYSLMNLEYCVVASRSQVGVVATLPRFEVIESPFFYTLGIVRSHENQTLVVGNPNCDCLGKYGFACDPFAAHDGLCLCRDYSLKRKDVKCLEIPSTTSLCVSYVKPTSVVGLETSEYTHKETIVGVGSCDTFLYPLCAHDIFHRDIEGMPNFEDNTLGESESVQGLSPWLLHPFDPVSTEDGKSFAEKESLYLMETSALESTNVDNAFVEVLTQIYHVMSRKAMENGENGNGNVPSKGGKVDLGKEVSDVKKFGWCSS
ncbi:Ras-related protein Rab11D [Capsicum annuum]|nr:Ras-related protein Rab11D [Capsicum annuum]